MLTALDEVATNYERLLNAESLTSVTRDTYSKGQMLTQKLTVAEARDILAEVIESITHYNELSEEFQGKLRDNLSFDTNIKWHFEGVTKRFQNKPHYLNHDDEPAIRLYWWDNWPILINNRQYHTWEIDLNTPKVGVFNRAEYAFQQIAATEEFFKIWQPLYAFDYIDASDMFPEDKPYKPVELEAWLAKNDWFLREPWRRHTETMVFSPELVARYNLKDIAWEDTNVCYTKWITDDILWIASDQGFRSDFDQHGYMNHERAELLYGSGWEWDIKAACQIFDYEPIDNVDYDKWDIDEWDIYQDALKNFNAVQEKHDQTLRDILPYSPDPRFI
ncbi:MAG: hypothetical protein AAF708_15250 [Deinococcota bacterium]